MVTSEAVVLTLQRDGEMELERGKTRSADKAFYVRQFAALSFPIQGKHLTQTH